MKTKLLSNSGGYYIIAHPQDGGTAYPIFDTSSGDAVAVFPSAAAAAHFCRTRHFGPEWSIGVLNANDLLTWLRHNLMEGIITLLIDPPADGAAAKSLPIFRILVEVEG